VRGAAKVTLAMGEGKRVAEAMLNYLKHQKEHSINNRMV
jgi:hypothetical protein